MQPLPVPNLRMLKLEAVSHYHQPAGRHPKPIAIPAYFERIELVTAGRGAILDGTAWREVTPGDLIWNGPGDETIGRSHFTDPYRCLAVTLVGRLARGLRLPRFSRWANLEEVRAFTLEAVQRFRDDRFDRAVLRDYLVGRLVYQVHADHGEKGGRGLPAPLQAAREWIAQKYAGPCPVTALARAAGWSPAHLHQAFRLHLGMTPHQAVLKERLRAAREMLLSTAHPVKRVAAECGFTDAPALSHVFKAATGLSPGAYRERYFSLSGAAPTPGGRPS